MIRVLVVDDDFMVAKVHSGYVERTAGFTVVGTAHTGADALRCVRELAPDLVLLDIYLPDIDGISVLRELRADQSTVDTDVIVITAARDAHTIRGAMRGGALHYLIKPFSYAALRDQLEHVGSLHEKLARLSAGGAPAQQDVDDVFASRPRGTGSLPKGLTQQTADLVRDALRDHPDGLSATECATVTELSRPSSRRYLEHFVSTGRAEVKLRYGGTGRPERQYHWRQ
ncbi:two-component system response regulator [Prauserella marina]|uniref:Transcriptional regulatory protein n=1 Tax=Prauserella marina TaxID=530584 RepID=A0A222VXE3_9PSEU|nr:response regulator [Prauserella marina]ASR38608.1 two-component system response regulator [Prauserella marina]PWV81933.1 response regulator of citrate/malate metabolism [Prauserella marina]SDD15643.1 Response regulator of citrate/malate metabolism [Prauserella marina]